VSGATLKKITSWNYNINVRFVISTSTLESGLPYTFFIKKQCDDALSQSQKYVMTL